MALALGGFLLSTGASMKVYGQTCWTDCSNNSDRFIGFTNIPMSGYDLTISAGTGTANGGMLSINGGGAFNQGGILSLDGGVSGSGNDGAILLQTNTTANVGISLSSPLSQTRCRRRHTSQYGEPSAIGKWYIWCGFGELGYYRRTANYLLQ